MTSKSLPFVSLMTEICGYILFVSVLAVMYGTVEEANATVMLTRHCLSPSNCLRYYNKSCDSGVQKKKVPVQTIPLFGLMGNCTSAPLPTTPTI